MTTAVSRQNLSQKEVYINVTGTGTATRAHAHNLQNAGGNYVFNLPASANAGQRIAFIGNEALTEIVTITPNGSDTIGPAGASYGMAAGDYLLLEDNGAGLWRIIERYGLIHVSGDTDLGQVVTNFLTFIEYPNNIVDLHQTFTTDTIFTARRNARYLIIFCWAWDSASEANLVLNLNGFPINHGPARVANGAKLASLVHAIDLVVGDTIGFWLTGNETGFVDPNRSYFSIQELA